jgi:hypothetical protein
MDLDELHVDEDKTIIWSPKTIFKKKFSIPITRHNILDDFVVGIDVLYKV